MKQYLLIDPEAFVVRHLFDDVMIAEEQAKNLLLERVFDGCEYISIYEICPQAHSVQLYEVVYKDGKTIRI
ncbi:MAG: hypothetical protein J6R05_04465 [Bacteroidaceae bacterium]|nr:hypothetical protein [Bacteroidaceae bacterium]